MKFLPVCVLLVVCFAVRGYADIQCYTCEDCGDLDDSLLATCPLPVTEAPTTTEGSTEDPSITTLSTADPSVTTLSTADPSVTTLSTADPSVTTLSTADPSATTPSTAAPTTSTDDPTTTTTTTTTTATTTTTTIAPEASIAGQIMQVLSQGPRHARSVLRAGPTYHCYSLDQIDGDNRKVKKGCVEVPEGREVCDVLKDENGESIENCSYCEDDRCNSSAALKFSLIAFVVAVSLRFIL